MRVLAFDTATAATATALCDEQTTITRYQEPPTGGRPGHAAQLLVQVDELLNEAGCRWDQIDRLAVGTGPGTFTGLRIGIATARALALAREIPLTGVSTLESLALAAAAEFEGSVLAAIDARRGEAFVAMWSACGGRLDRRLTAPSAVVPEALAAIVRAESQGVLAVGSGAVLFESLLARAGAEVPPADSVLHRVDAANHCRLAFGARSRDHREILPEYLRLADAELALRRREHGAEAPHQ